MKIAQDFSPGYAAGWPTFAWFWQMWVFSAEHPHISSLRSQMWVFSAEHPHISSLRSQMWATPSARRIEIRRYTRMIVSPYLLASSTARTSAWALLRDSSYSRSGTESATMPAPACT